MWIFHDSRPGHLSQLEGLVNRLAFHVNCETRWFDVNKQKLTLLNFFYAPKYLKNITKPELIIGAGHSTHLSVLIAGFKFKAFTTIIMKPSLPIWLFDAIICPKHDGLKDTKRTLTTFGPMNKIDIQEKNLAKNKTIKLMLIGGDSKHYHFDSAQIIEQIKQICFEQARDQWILSNSPRTPQDMNNLLKQLDLPNLSFHDYQQNDIGKLQDILPKTQFTWVTPDSMSMIFEALTADSQVGLFNCKPKNTKRIVTQVKRLIDESHVVDFEHKGNAHGIKTEIPWEADRAALWLLNRFDPDFTSLRADTNNHDNA